jgi:CelD/BcsL family acetyltransferase involved in cellulose biosynthesis
MYFAGYDPTWRRYSVMTILMSEIIKWAIANKFQRVNLSTGNDQSKLRWKPDEIVFHNAVQVSPTRRARLVFPAFVAYESWSRGRRP